MPIFINSVEISPTDVQINEIERADKHPLLFQAMLTAMEDKTVLDEKIPVKIESGPARHNNIKDGPK